MSRGYGNYNAPNHFSPARWHTTLSQLCVATATRPEEKAGEGNRTLVCSLGSYRSTIELHPRPNTDCRFHDCPLQVGQRRRGITSIFASAPGKDTAHSRNCPERKNLRRSAVI